MNRGLLLRSVTPGGRLLGGCAVIIAVGTARPSLIALGVTLAAFVLVLWGTRPPLRRVQRRLLWVTLGGLSVLVPFVLGGDATRAATLALRVSSAALAAVATSLMLPGQELALALTSLRAPRVLASVMTHALGQLGEVVDETERIVLARRLRGATGVQANAELVTTLLVRSADRAVRRGLAAELRGAELRSPTARVLDIGSIVFLMSCTLIATGVHWA